MTTRARLGLAILLTLFLATAVRHSYERLPLVDAQASCCEIDTSNEAVPLGDWDASYIFQGPAGFIVRSNTYVQEGTYSYQHYSDCPNSFCWAWTYIECGSEMESGYADGWFLLPAKPGHGGTEEHNFMSLAEVSTGPWAWADYNGWTLYWDYQEKSAMLTCRACSPEIIYHLAPMNDEQWYHFRVEWDLPANSAAGSIAAWQDDYQYVNASGLTTEPGFWYTNDAVGVGVGNWQFVWSDEFDIYVDNVDISSCDPPDPTPTPEPSAAEQYGHAAVLNVDDDCSAILRFRAVPNYVPFDAVVQRATLHLWGAASEVLGETIYVAPLIPLWGEMTCDWCRRTVGESWADPGATNIPLDRYPGSVATFETALGWIEVDIPPYLVEDWALSSASNPGLILHNVDLTGKFGIASREWIDADYTPYMTIYYTD